MGSLCFCMRKLGVLKTEEQLYKVTKQEKGKRATSSPRCPVKIYEKDSSGGWSHLETLDGEKPSANKRMAYTDMESDSTSWANAIDSIRFYDSSAIVEEKKSFRM